MKHTALNTFVLVIYLMVYLFTQQNYEWDIIRSMMKDANNFAVHDAGQETNEVFRSQGKIVFDSVSARSTYEETLKLNLGLDYNFTPKPGSRMKNKIEVLEFLLFDDSNTTFPFLYESETYKITKLIVEPSVLAVIRTNHPILLERLHIQDPVQIASIYELKRNQY